MSYLQNLEREVIEEADRQHSMLVTLLFRRRRVNTTLNSEIIHLLKKHLGFMSPTSYICNKTKSKRAEVMSVLKTLVNDGEIEYTPRRGNEEEERWGMRT